MYLSKDPLYDVAIQPGGSLAAEFVVSIEVEHKQWLRLRNGVASSKKRRVDGLPLFERRVLEVEFLT